MPVWQIPLTADLGWKGATGTATADADAFHALVLQNGASSSGDTLRLSLDKGRAGPGTYSGSITATPDSGIAGDVSATFPSALSSSTTSGRCICRS